MKDNYYIIMEVDCPEHPTLTPDDKTAERSITYKKLEFTSPLVFLNGFRKENLRNRTREKIADVLFGGAEVLIKSHIKEAIEPFGFANLQFYPAIYIDNDDHRHDDYWFVNIFKKLECLDTENSEFEPPEDMNDPYDHYDVRRYVLSEEALSRTPVDERLLFKISRTTIGYTLMNQRIVDVFCNLNATGIRYFNIDDFKEGDQYSPTLG